MRLLIGRRRSSPELGWGSFTVIPQSAPSVLVHEVSSAEGRMVAIHNFRGEPETAAFRLTDLEPGDRLVDLLVDDRVIEPDDGGITIALDGYGYRWLRVINPDGKRLG